MIINYNVEADSYDNSWSQLTIQSFSIDCFNSNSSDNSTIVLKEGLTNTVRIKFQIYCGFGAIGNRKVIKQVSFGGTNYDCNLTPSSTSTRWVYGDVTFNIGTKAYSSGFNGGPTFRDGTGDIVATTKWKNFNRLLMYGDQYVERVVPNFELSSDGLNLQGSVQVYPPRPIEEFKLVCNSNGDKEFPLSIYNISNGVYNINFNNFNNSDIYEWSSMRLLYKRLNINIFDSAGGININSRFPKLNNIISFVQTDLARYSDIPPTDWQNYQNEIEIDVSNLNLYSYSLKNCDIINNKCIFMCNKEPKIQLTLSSKNYEFSLLTLMNWTSYFPLYNVPNYNLSDNFNLIHNNDFKLVLKENKSLPVITLNNCSDLNSIKFFISVCGYRTDVDPETHVDNTGITKEYYEVSWKNNCFTLPRIADEYTYKLFLKIKDNEKEIIVQNCEEEYEDENNIITTRTKLNSIDMTQNEPLLEIDDSLTNFDEENNVISYYIKKEGNYRYKDDPMIIKNRYTGNYSYTGYTNRYAIKIIYTDNSFNIIEIEAADVKSKTFYIDDSNISPPLNEKLKEYQFGFYVKNNEDIWEFYNFKTIYPLPDGPTVVYFPHQIGINCEPQSNEVLRISAATLEENNQTINLNEITIGPGITINIDAQTLVTLLNSANLTFSGNTWSTSS